MGRCNLLWFWEAGFRGEWGVGGAGERRGGFWGWRNIDYLQQALTFFFTLEGIPRSKKWHCCEPDFPVQIDPFQ